MTAFTMEIQGMDRLVAWLLTAPQNAIYGIEKGLYKRALAIMERSQQIVPVGGAPTSPRDPAPGTLKASGVVELPVTEGTVVSVSLGYGGAASAYAFRQHEDLTYRHKAGQEAKYLERPIMEDEPNILPAIAEALQERF